MPSPPQRRRLGAERADPGHAWGERGKKGIIEHPEHGAIGRMAHISVQMGFHRATGVGWKEHKSFPQPVSGTQFYRLKEVQDWHAANVDPSYAARGAQSTGAKNQRGGVRTGIVEHPEHGELASLRHITTSLGFSQTVVTQLKRTNPDEVPSSIEHEGKHLYPVGPVMDLLSRHGHRFKQQG